VAIARWQWSGMRTVHRRTRRREPFCNETIGGVALDEGDERQAASDSTCATS
jgi:hypothetical protein